MTKAKTSYAIGWQAGAAFKAQGVEIEEADFLDGLRAALSGGESKWDRSGDDGGDAGAATRDDGQATGRSRGAEQGRYVTAGEEFLASNKEREGVTTTASGLQYEVITGGDGPSPAATDTVTVHYRGTLIDGTEFDSSYARNAPATFALNQVIPGWTEGVQLMSVGSKFRVLYVPSELGYGMRGAGPKIGPGAALIFEVELLEIAE